MLSRIFQVAKSIFFSGLDPLFDVDPRALRRTEDFCKEYFLKAATICFSFFLGMWLIAIFINDLQKSNASDWIPLRLFVIIAILILSYSLFTVRRSMIASHFLVVFLATTLSASYSWSYRLGQPLSRGYIVVLAALPVALVFRSYIIAATSTAVILFSTAQLWSPMRATFSTISASRPFSSG